MEIKLFGVIGSGIMGRGIAHVAAQNGYNVIMQDISADALAKALQLIAKELDKGIERGKATVEEKEATLKNIDRKSVV